MPQATMTIESPGTKKRTPLPSMLVVDDNPRMLTCVQLMLEAKRVECVADFQETYVGGVSLLERKFFKVLLCDYDLRDPDGHTGEHLLWIAKRRSPETLRVLMSGTEPPTNWHQFGEFFLDKGIGFQQQFRSLIEHRLRPLSSHGRPNSRGRHSVPL